MKIVKTNKKHARHDKYKFFIQFGKPYKETRSERNERVKYSGKFFSLYGSWINLVKNEETGLHEYKINPYWLMDRARSRIYFNNESDLLAIALKD